MVTTARRQAQADPTRALLDQYGNQIQPTAAPETERLTLASLRDRFYAYPAHGLTPERLATILKEADQGELTRQAELFQEMLERDAKLQSLFQTRQMSVAGLDWRIEPADESREAAALAEEVEHALRGLDMAILIAHLLDGVPYGYAGSEILWSAGGGRVGIRGLLPVPVCRFTYLPRGAEPIPVAPRLITDQAPIFGVDLPPWKFMVHTPRARGGSAVRAGLMRTCCWLYLFKHYSIKDWVAFSEVYGMPLRLGKYQSGASADDRQALLAAVRSIGHDAAGIISSSTEIEFVQAAGQHTPDLYEALIDLLNKEMAQAVLGQTLTSDVGSVGSLAAARVHGEVRFDLMEADATALAGTITQQLIRPLVGFTHGWDVPGPRFAFEIEEPKDKGAEATVLKTLVEAGFGSAIPLAIVQEQFSIRAPKDGEATVGDGQHSAISDQRSAKTALSLKTTLAADAGVAAEQQAVDMLAARALDDWEALVTPLLDPVRQIIDGSTTLEEARGRVLTAYPEMDDTAVTDLLARALFVADAWGRVHA